MGKRRNENNSQKWKFEQDSAPKNVIIIYNKMSYYKAYMKKSYW